MLLKLRKRMQRKDNQKGFTLVELIIVMAILAILVVLAVPKFATVLEDSKHKAHNANVHQIIKAGQLYYAQENGKTTSDINNLVSENYLKAVPTNPVKNTQNYTCEIKADGDVIVSPGKMKKGNSGTWVLDTSN